MIESHPSSWTDVPMFDRFLSFRLGALPRQADRSTAPAPQRAADAPPVDDTPAGERVLAQVPGELRRDALVVTRLGGHYDVRRVGRVTDDQVELLPVDDPAAARAERVRRDDERVVGTVLLRWSDG